MRFPIVFLLAALPYVLPGQEHIYLAQAAAGSADGSSCFDPRPYTYFNARGNWGTAPGQIKPGSTVHLCGVITAPPQTNALLFQGGGTAGQPVTIQFEKDAVLASPGWPSTGAIGLRRNSYVVVDGGGTGVITATDSGSSLTHKTVGTAIHLSESSNVEIRNLRITSLYVHDSVLDDGPINGGAGGCVYANGFGDNILIHDNLMQDAAWCITLLSGSATGLAIYNNDISRVDHGVALGFGRSDQSLSEVHIYGNRFGATANWDTQSNRWHHDGIHAYNYAGASTHHWYIYNNRFEGDWGRNNTAHIFLEKGLSNIYVFNNVFAQFPGNKLNNGMVAMGDVNQVSLLNNTFLCDPTVSGAIGILSNASQGVTRNNLFSSCQTYVSLKGALGAGALDTNVYCGSPGGGNQPWFWQNKGVAQLAAWQQLTGNDLNSLSCSQAGVAADGALIEGSAAAGAGANLTSLGIAPLNADRLGTQRPATGRWDAGAVNAVQPPPLAPPGNLNGQSR